MKPDKALNTEQPDDRTEPLSSPYGPHPGHIDDASGGADSSPFDNVSSDERAARQEAIRRSQTTDDEAPRH